MTNTGLINNVTWFSLFIFFTNSLSFVLFFELHLYDEYGFIKCADSWLCYYKNFKVVHSYIIPVYFFLSIAYASLFYKLKLYKGFNSKTINRWLVSLVAIYGLCLLMYVTVVFSRGVYIGAWYAWFLFVPVEFALELTMGKYSEVTLLLAITTTLSTLLYRRLWANIKVFRGMMELNLDFFLLTFFVSILFFCTITASYVMTYNGKFDGTGYGFPFVWYVREAPSSDLNQYTYVYINKLIFDFIVYLLVVGSIFWVTFAFRGNRIYLITQSRLQFCALTTASILTSLAFFRNLVFQGFAFLNLDYEPIFHTMKLHIGI